MQKLMIFLLFTGFIIFSSGIILTVSAQQSHDDNIMESLKVPSPPINVIPTRGDSIVELNWNLSNDYDFLMIYDYIIEYTVVDELSWTVYDDGFTKIPGATITGLTTGVEYSFRVLVVSELGTSEPSESVNVFFAGYPDEVTDLDGMFHEDNQVMLTWNTPSDDGGYPITDYKIMYSAYGNTLTEYDDGISIETNSVVTGLTSNTVYSFLVYPVTVFVSETQNNHPIPTIGMLPNSVYAIEAIDSDEDGVPNSVDFCPNLLEDYVTQHGNIDGCPSDFIPWSDADYDGIRDYVDQCPNVKEVYNQFQDEDGCPDYMGYNKTDTDSIGYNKTDTDFDGDNYPDHLDLCPNQPETYNGIDDKDGCPDNISNLVDSDQDGISDTRDICPLEPEIYNMLEDTDGCPES